MSSKFSEIRLEPLIGLLDMRSPSGTLDFRTFRLLLNVDGSKNGGVCRLPGWRKYLGLEDCYYNQDLHDQLVGGQNYYESYQLFQAGWTAQNGYSWSLWGPNGPYFATYLDGLGNQQVTTGPYQLPIYTRIGDKTYDYCGGIQYTLGNSCREAITLLHSFENETSQRRLIAATKSRVYVADEKGGNWRMLADGLGGSCETDQDCICSRKRFTAATNGQTVTFANGIDPVFSWTFDDLPSGCDHWSADFVQDLIGLQIDTAGLVGSWQGFTLIARTTSNGQYIPGRFYWSDFNAPGSFAPESGISLAGFHDFGASEDILAWGAIGGRFRIYTSLAIYDVTVSSDENLVFNVQEIYRGPYVPVYRYSLVITGDRHWYCSQESVYVMAEWDREPTLFDWVNKSVGSIYEGVPAAWLRQFTDLVQPILPLDKSQCEMVVGGYDPERRAVWFSWPSGGGTKTPDTSLIIWPKYNTATVVDHGFTAFVAHKPDLIPSVRDWLATSGVCRPSENLLPKQGAPCDLTFIDAGFLNVWNDAEDPEQPLDPNGFLATLQRICLEDVCNTCDTDLRFIMASAADKCLKEFDPSFYGRETLSTVAPAVFPAAGVATYTIDPYVTLLQGDAYRYKTDADKYAKAIAFNFTSDDQTIPGELRGEVGVGMQPDCLTWERAEKVLPIGVCMDQPAEDDGFTRQGEVPHWPFYARGSYIGWRVWTSGTGNQFCSSSMTVKVLGVGNCW